MSITWLEETVEGGEVSFRVGREASGALVAEWPHEARLVQTTEGFRFEPEPHLASARAAKLARGPVRAVARYVSGEMSLHASAVEIGARALVFLGPSGAGKSTTAALLCERSGAQLLADDVLAVESVDDQLVALPTEEVHWLEMAGEPQKQARTAARVATRPTAVAAIVLLGVNESPLPAQPTPLKGRLAMLALSSAHVTLPIATPAERRRDFEWLAEVYDRVPMVRIERRCAGTVDDVASAALDLLK
jgi:hypothetical protein